LPILDGKPATIVDSPRLARSVDIHDPDAIISVGQRFDMVRDAWMIDGG
jgi:hypothetical protein